MPLIVQPAPGPRNGVAAALSWPPRKERRAAGPHRERHREDLRDRLVSSPDFAGNALFAYQAALEDMNNISMQLPTYDTRETRRELEGSGIVCAPADEKLFETYFNYLRGIGFMPAPETLNTWEGIHA